MLVIIVAPACHAAGASVVLNEILIDPVQSVELYNSGEDAADISGWIIDDGGGTTYFTVPPDTVLPSQHCIVFTSPFSLNKSTPDTARLFAFPALPTEVGAVPLDSYSYTASPGSNTSFQRIPDGTPLWASASASLELRNLENTPCILQSTATPTPYAFTTPSPTPGTAGLPDIPEGTVYISEAGVYPSGSEHEWVEVFNANEFEVTLSGWYIDDIRTGGGTKVGFSRVIAARSFAVITLESALFNNGGDVISLLDDTEEFVDELTFDSAKKGYSVGRIGDGSSTCLMKPTPGTQNGECIIIMTPTMTPSPGGKYPSGASAAAATPPPRITDATQQTVSKRSSAPTPSLRTDSHTEPKAIVMHQGSEDESNKIARTLSFSSLSASVLTIISVLFKMKGE